MAGHIEQAAIVVENQHGARLDRAAAELFPEFSRARLQGWIKDGSLQRNGEVARQRDKVERGDRLSLSAHPLAEVAWRGESIELEVVYEDESILVIDKPAGLVVHPGAGHPGGTLLNALLAYRPQLSALPRAGIVHRLDKDTSGLMVVAGSLPAHANLVGQLQNRSVGREYAAVCSGAMSGGGTIDEPIARHPRARKKMAVATRGGKEAITRYRVVGRFAHHTHIAVKPETGRTHQIRVHLSHRRYPLVGDRTYGGRLRLPAGAASELVAMLRGFPRQALHARALGLRHPRSGEFLQWRVELPEDMRQLLRCLQTYDRA